MAWIELHQELAQHRKLDRLIKDTGLGRDAALGRLCLLWLWALQNRPDGDLSDLDAKRAAEIFGVTPRKAAPFLEALERCGFLDRAGESLRIHDWEDYTDRDGPQRGCCLHPPPQRRAKAPQPGEAA